VRFWLTTWLGLWALYLLLVFKTESAEIVAGAVCGAIGATATNLVRTHGNVHFAWPRGWWRGLLRVPAAIVVDSGRLIVVLWRVIVRREDVRGRSFTVPMRGVRGDSVEAVSRRALIKWIGSFSPNTLVMGFDEQRGDVLVHQLVPTDEPPWLDPTERPTASRERP
jgi:multisubunit Na+/H+ antiporter MnhE subunit